MTKDLFFFLHSKVAYAILAGMVNRTTICICYSEGEVVKVKSQELTWKFS